MSIYPQAVVRLKPHQSGEGLIVPRAVILHSICGGYRAETLGGLEGLRSAANALESTFGVDGDGTVYQLRDTRWHCDANYFANDFAISIETESSIGATEPWLPEQYRAIVELVKWCCAEHGIPRRRIPAWDSSGVGYHTMWGAPSQWTPVAKTCPGPARIAQFPQVVRDVADDNWSSDVAITEAEFARIRKEVITALSDSTHAYLQDELEPLKLALAAMKTQAASLAAQSTSLAAQSTHLAAQVAKLTSGSVTDTAAVAKATNDDVARRMGRP